MFNELHSIAYLKYNNCGELRAVLYHGRKQYNNISI
jgi:hypothetical protein